MKNPKSNQATFMANSGGKKVLEEPGRGYLRIVKEADTALVREDGFLKKNQVETTSDEYGREEGYEEKNEAYEAYVHEVIDAVQGLLGDEYHIHHKKERKNNCVMLDGLMMKKKEEKIVPNIYLNSYYEDYCKGESVASIAKRIVQVYFEKQEEIHKLSKNLDFSKEYIKDHVYFRLIGQKWNEDLLINVPHTKFLDLAMIYYWVAYEEQEQVGSVMISNAQMEYFGFTEEELGQYAKENTRRLFPASIRKIDEVLCGLIEGELDIPMLIVSNNKGVNGASCLLYPGILRELSEKLSGNFYVLPSSVHEVIAIPESGQSTEQLLEMVSYVNQTQVPKDEILSNDVYFYSVEKDELIIAA